MIKYFCDLCGKETQIKDGIFSAESYLKSDGKLISFKIVVKVFWLDNDNEYQDNPQVCKKCIDGILANGDFKDQHGNFLLLRNEQ